jgi:predicted AAA+ superfamily ATPase
MDQGVEGIVAQHLRAWCDYSDGNNKLYYWKTAGGIEVDFVICGEDGLLAFEVKSTTTPQPKHFRGLYSFKREHPMAKLTLLHMGDFAGQMAGITCIPCETFLRNLKPNSMPFQI